MKIKNKNSRKNYKEIYSYQVIQKRKNPNFDTEVFSKKVLLF